MSGAESRANQPLPRKEILPNSQIPFFDPEKTYEQNYTEGPFGAFADGKVFEEEGEPQYEVFGKKVYTPFGIPAGPLLNGRYVDASLKKGYDVVVHKTVRSRAYKCNPFPNVLAVHIDGDLTPEKASGQLLADKDYSQPLSITNSFGNPSRDPKIWQKEIAESVKHAKKGQMVWGSFEGTRWNGAETTHEEYIEDWVRGALLLKEAGVAAIELNFSCPNEGTSNLLCFDYDKVEEIAKRVKTAIGDTPLVMKSAYQTEEGLRELVSRTGRIFDGYSVINTISAEVVDENGNQALPGEGRLRSGVCGDAIRWAGLDITKRLKDIKEEMGMKYTIVGVGGAGSKEDFDAYIDAGADVVMSATAAMWNPMLAQEIKQAA